MRPGVITRPHFLLDYITRNILNYLLILKRFLRVFKVLILEDVDFGMEVIIIKFRYESCFKYN